MKPGRELDAKVATHVMGWKLSADASEWLDAGGEYMKAAEYWHIGGNDDILPWSPSTDIAAAWAVWRKLTERFFCCKISFISQRIPKCRVTLYRHAESVQFGDPSFEAAGETAMQAICLAALEAAGVICVPEGESITLGDRAVLENVTIMGVGVGDD